MSFAIDLKEYGHELSKWHEGVISSDPETTWAIFGYDGAGNALKPFEHGSGDLDEFVESFDDSQIEYGLVRVEFNGINKIVLVGFCGENVSGRKRLVFNSHMATVAKQFNGHHIQFTALSADDLTPQAIMDRVSQAAGSKYVGSAKPAPPTKPKYVKVEEGANEDDWGDSVPVEERELTRGANGNYKSSARDELLAFRQRGSAPLASKASPSKLAEQRESATKQSKQETKPETKPESPRGISGLDSGTSYQPVGKIDLKAIRAEAKGSKFADSRVEKIEPSYKPVGKVDIKAIREQARKEKQLKLEREVSKPNNAAPSAVQKSAESETLINKNTAKESTPTVARKQPIDEDESSNENNLSKYELSSNASESEYQAPDRRSEYGVSKNTARKSTPNDDDDAPQFSSLADRMKAFQQSVSGAKPQFDVKSTRKNVPTAPRSASSRLAEPQELVKSVNGEKQKLEDKQKDEQEDEDDHGPVSVAAQLAKARLSSKKEPTSDQSDLKAAREASYGINKESITESESAKSSNETPRANVSSFAARFAKKSEPVEPKETKAPVESKEPVNEKSAPLRQVPAPPAPEEEEEEEAPPAPSRPAAAAAEPVAPPAPARREILEPKDEEDEDDEELSAVVIQEYEKNDDDEIALTINETISVIQKADENWWIGKNSHGEVGLFPADYVKEIDSSPSAPPAPVSKAVEPEEAMEPEEAVEPEEADSEEQIALALYSHDPEPEDEDELRFEEGEKIVILDFTSDDWFTGRNSKNEVGLVPAAYLELK